MTNNPCAAWTKGDPLVLKYHDTRWGKVCHDERELFAMLCLEGMQAGLSWATIVKKEEAMREAYDGFNPEILAGYSEDDVRRLMGTDGIVKNERKIRSVIGNAKAYLKFMESGEYKSFDEYIWHFTGGVQIVHHFKILNELPSSDSLSTMISNDLKSRGFSFVGPVIIYSYLQAIGVYDDHLDSCPCKNNQIYS